MKGQLLVIFLVAICVSSNKQLIIDDSLPSKPNEEEWNMRIDALLNTYKSMIQTQTLIEAELIDGVSLEDIQDKMEDIQQVKQARKSYPNFATFWDDFSNGKIPIDSVGCCHGCLCNGGGGDHCCNGCWLGICL